MTDANAASPLAVARRLLQERQAEDALAVIQEIIAADQDSREAQDLLGMTLFMLKRFEESRDAFEHLTRMDPRNATPYVNLGAVLNVLKDYQGATKVLRNAIKRDKKCSSAYYNMGIAQRALKMNSMAISAYREAIRLEPEMADAYVNLGNLYIEMNNLTQAVRLLQDGVDKCPASKKLPVILEKAKQAKDGIKVDASPLGRLVDEEELQRRNIRTAPRQLDAVTRNEERESLHVIGKRIRRATRPIVELIGTDLQRQLHIIDLAAKQHDQRNEAPIAMEEMEQTLKNIDYLRGIVREAVGEIREGLQKTDPGF